MHRKKHLSFNGLRKTIAQRFNEINDPRRGVVEYSVHDCLMSALAMMYFQDPSLLAFQRRLQEAAQKNNLKSIFQVEAIPADTQLRSVIDQCDPAQIESIFTDFFRGLQRGKHLEPYRLLSGRYLILLDGSEYFGSEKIHCPSCLRTKKALGKVQYHHQILQAVMAHPDSRIVLPMAPEAISNEDGTEKQDCEINAAKRVIKKIRKNHPKLPIVICGDGLYSKQPFVSALKEARMSFVLVAKSKDHKVLFEWMNEMRAMGEINRLEAKDQEGRRHVYQWANGIPLNGSPKADDVNFFEYSLIRKDGKATVHNSWITDIEIHEANIEELVRCGRARWKIENEGFNTLKNQGYHLEHNFGHGNQNLSYNFFLLNLIAFTLHQILQLTDSLYQKCRAKSGARIEFWNLLRYAIRLILFNNWDHLLSFILDSPQLQAPDP